MTPLERIPQLPRDERRLTPAELVHSPCERRLAARVEGHERRPGHTPAPQLEDSDRNGIVESPRPGAGGIEVADAVDQLVVRQVAVAEDDHVRRITPQLGADLGPGAMRPIEDVREEELHAVQHHASGLSRIAAAKSVDVPGDRGHRRQLTQRRQHVLSADVSAVEDVVDAAQSRDGLRAEKAVRVRDDADAHMGNLTPLVPEGLAPRLPRPARACDKRAVELLTETPPGWIRFAVERFDEVLVDHAHCEKKAAAHALSMLAAFPDVPGLARAMAQLAREEAGHLAQVLRLLEQRGLSLGKDPGDPYAQALQERVRHPRTERLLDRLLISALIELRSQERLALLATHLPQPDLREVYGRLASAEAGHGDLFWKLALKASRDEAPRRWAELAAEEARIVRSLPLRAAIH